MIECARNLLGENPWRKVANSDVWSKQVLRIFMTHIAHTLVGATAIGIVGACEHTVGGVGEIISFIGVITRFEISAIALSIDNTKIGFHTQWLGQLLQQSLKIINRDTVLQGEFHHHTFLVHFALRYIVVVEIIGCRVHDCEPHYVESGPCCGVGTIRSVENSNKLIAVAMCLYEFHTVIGATGVAMFPQ